MPNAEYTGKPDGWKRFLGTVRETFPGPNNAGVRKQIRETAAGGGSLGLLGRTLALTASGKAGLRNCDDALADWDGRSARGQYEAMRATGSL